MNAIQVLQIATRISSVLDGISADRKRKIRKNDALVYLAARELAIQYEKRNPGVHEECGYLSPIGDID